MLIIPWLSFWIVVLIIWTAYSWLPSSRVTRAGAVLTKLATPIIVRLLNLLHPILDRSVAVASSRYSAENHTGLYEREDLIDLLEQQQRQSDSRISDEELEISKRALRFSD